MMKQQPQNHRRQFQLFLPTLWIWIGFTVGACSFMGLGEFDTRELSSNEECTDLNQSNGIDITSECMIYQYVKGGLGCELRMADWDDDGFLGVQCAQQTTPDTIDCDDFNDDRYPLNLETCDGVDNNCNEVIDEEVLLTSQPVVKIENTGAISFGTATHSRDGQLGLFYSVDGTAYRGMSGPEYSLQNQSPVVYTYQTTQDNPALPATNDGYCIQDDAAGAATQSTCNFTQIATDRLDSGDWITATINTSGCADGQLRVGYMNNEDSRFVLRGPAQHSNIFKGVDVAVDSSTGQCTGASRQAPSATLGVTKPATAALTPINRDYAQGIIGWLADSASRDQCGSSAVNVEILGVWLESVTNIESQWINGTNNGIPQSLTSAFDDADHALGQTVGGAPPEITATMRTGNFFLDEGYFIAHGNGLGTITMYFVPTFIDPPPYIYATPVATQTIRDTAPLNLGADAIATGVLSAGIAQADYVQMALGRYQMETDKQTIGVTWQQGCNTNEVSIHFAIATYTEGNPGNFTFSSPILLNDNTGAAIASAPTLMYQPSGFVSPKFERNGQIAQNITGGWMVVWTEIEGAHHTIRSRRVLDLDGLAIGNSSTKLAQSSGQLDILSVYPIEQSNYPSKATLSYYDGSANQLLDAGLLCNPQ